MKISERDIGRHHLLRMVLEGRLTLTESAEKMGVSYRQAKRLRLAGGFYRRIVQEELSPTPPTTPPYGMSSVLCARHFERSIAEARNLFFARSYPIQKQISHYVRNDIPAILNSYTICAVCAGGLNTQHYTSTIWEIQSNCAMKL